MPSSNWGAQQRRGQDGGRGSGAVVSSGRRPDDAPNVNRDRLTFCILRLVGRRVTAKLRGNVIYEGLFHSCDLGSSDHSITLLHARRVALPASATVATEDTAGEIEKLIISGKDWLQISGLDLPSPFDADEPGRRRFPVDGDIARSAGETEGRELVPWSDDSAGPAFSGMLSNSLEGEADGKSFDQFEQAKRMGVVSSGFQMDLYTTKLDTKLIDPETVKRAEETAREIEAGKQHAEVEGGDGDDEEAAYAASQPAKARQEELRPAAPAKASASAPVPQLPAQLKEHEAALSNLLSGDGLTRGDLKGQQKRGMISEMKRINALNLEPTLPKLDDSARSSRINFTKDGQARNTSRLTQGSGDLKMEFQQSLEVIQKQEANKQRKAASQNAGDTSARSGAAASPAAAGMHDAQWGPGQQMGQLTPYGQKPGERTPQGGGYPGSANGGDAVKGGKSPFAFNPQAKSFSLNPQAGEFTPSGAAAAATGPTQPMNKPVASTLSANFPIQKKSPEMLRKSLQDLLDPFFHKAKDSAQQATRAEWQNAKGPTYNQVLGQPNPGRQGPMMQPGAGPGAGPGPVPGAGWQQPQGPPDQAPAMGQMPQGNGPQMMQPGYAIAQAPGQGAPPQMYQQMFAAPGGQGPGQGPQNPQQGGGGMPPQSQQNQGPGMMMGTQGMMMAPTGQQQGQQMMMVAATQGPNGPQGMGMTPMPKFPGQGQPGQGQQQMMMVMLAPGQGGCFPQQGFMPQGPVQGPPGQGPPQGPGPPGQGDSQQGHMMQQQMYPRQGGQG